MSETPTMDNTILCVCVVVGCRHNNKKIRTLTLRIRTEYKNDFINGYRLKKAKQTIK